MRLGERFLCESQHVLVRHWLRLWHSLLRRDIRSRLIYCGKVWSYKGKDREFSAKYCSVEYKGSGECAGRSTGSVTDIRTVIRPIREMLVPSVADGTEEAAHIVG